VHPGFNPKPGTLKARFCVAGNQRIKEFCHRTNVPFKQVGLLVVARTPDECSVVEELYRRGQFNGVPDLQILSQKKLNELEPNAKGCAALYAPSGAIVDSRQLVRSLAQEAYEHGVTFFFGHPVRCVEHDGHSYCVHTSRQSFHADFLINAAGLYADHIAHMMGAGVGYTILPVRGEYYQVRAEKAHLVRRLIYPVPHLHLPFLGIHFTPTIAGGLKVGPNAVVALGREAYANTQINLRETWAMLMDRRIWRLLGDHEFRQVTVRFLRTSLSRRAFLHEASTLVEGLSEADLLKGPLPGIRAQLVNQSGQLVDDMIIEKKENSLHILNVVSPGLTCALPFAEYLVNLL
jgi:L-2-hydroxyglutarate oxidase LhgO